MKLEFKSNIARDILQSAQTFKYPQLVVWEYVVNEIEYRNKNSKPKVYVEIDKNSISISGNGAGMDETDLKHFFTMHAENRERKKGNTIRGNFGTGKSAAFAIGHVLNVNTVKDKKEYEVELRYEELKNNRGDNVPIKIIKDGVKTSKKNGTTITINNLFKSSKIIVKDIIGYLEKHLKFFKDAEVWVGTHQCEAKEPETKKIFKFNSAKEGFDNLGNIDLTIKIAAEPLEKEEKGIAIHSNRACHETTLSGSEGREMSEYIFGEINCPQLDDDSEEIAAFDMSRSGKLNAHHPTVIQLYSFIGQKVEEVRKKLVQENENKKKSEEAQKLQKQADNIAKIINDHFKDYVNKIKILKTKKSDGSNQFNNSSFGDEEDSESLSAGDELAALLNDGSSFFGLQSNKNKSNNNLVKNKIKNKHLNQDEDEDSNAKKRNSSGNKNSSGGNKFSVEYKENGKQNKRAIFHTDSNTVFINLENPYVQKLKKTGDEETFSKITYEIAFTEYAMGLVRLMYTNKYYKDNTDEYLQEVRNIVNDLSDALS